VELLRLTARVEADPEVVQPVSRDPDDHYLIALAAHAGAHVLVSGDQDLLSVEGAQPPIVRPGRFLSSLDPDPA